LLIAVSILTKQPISKLGGLPRPSPTSWRLSRPSWSRAYTISDEAYHRSPSVEASTLSLGLILIDAGGEALCRSIWQMTMLEV
jgi:hypothetical protein